MCLRLRNDFSKANFSFHFFELKTDPICLSETKSYGISLSFSDRISLYISGALSWSQFKNNDPFYIQQSEIQFLNIELAWLVFIILAETMFLNYSFNHAQAESVLNHYKNGTLNETTIAKIESEFKNKTAAKRTAAAASEKPAE